jgi:hybrid cluster-associated redox disulfide protein
MNATWSGAAERSLRCNKSASFLRSAGWLRWRKEPARGSPTFGIMARRTPEIAFDTTVDEVMRLWPATIRVFLDFRMGCVGCPIATFHTVADTCGEHRVDRETFLAALRGAAASENPDGSVAGRLFGNAEQAVRIAQDDALAAALDQTLLLPGT